MPKFWKILIVVILIAISVFFIVKQFQGIDIDKELEAMKESLITDPVVNVTDLTDEQLQNFLDTFEKAKQDVIGADFDTLQGVNAVAFIKQSLGDFEGAIIAYEYGNLIRPRNSLTFSNLATLYHFDFQDFEKAEKNYLISIANDPDDILTIRNLYELYFYALEDNKKTEGLLLNSIKNNPEVADLYSLSGSFYRDIGETVKAIEMFERHLELNPSSTAVRQALEKLRADE